MTSSLDPLSPDLLEDALVARPGNLPVADEFDASDSDKHGHELEWPRLVAPPLKRSGHVILEACTVSGKHDDLIVRDTGQEPTRLPMS